MYNVKLFTTSNDAADTVDMLRYKLIEKMPFRMLIKKAAAETDAQESLYDLGVVATAGNDMYLMNVSGGKGIDGKYFKWNKEFDSKGKRDTEWGVDCAAGMDPLLVLAIVISAGPNGMGNATGVNVFVP